MIKRVIPGKHIEIKPDVLIPYSGALDRERLGDSAITIVSVRPETNKVIYEAEIIKSFSPYADAVYLANLSGNLVNDKAIIAWHYSSQLQFAINGKDEMERYPEMIRKFEEKFKTDFSNAPSIGAFEAILDYKIRKDADDLFRTMVPDTDFLEMFGQTIKKINGHYVLNYDIPAIITRHHADTGMFIIAFRLKQEDIGFSDIHHLIYENMCKNEGTVILGPEARKKLPLEWYNQVRRTYHISRSHIEAMFDLTDYVFKNEKERIGYIDTPLGQRLVDKGIVPKEQLEKRMTMLKENPLVYLKSLDGDKRLVDIIHEGKVVYGPSFMEFDLDECCKIISRIDWEHMNSG